MAFLPKKKPIPLHETFMIIRPYLAEHGIRIGHVPAHNLVTVWVGEEHHLLMADGDEIVVDSAYQGGQILPTKAFKLCDPDSLPQLVAYLKEISDQ